MAILQNEERLKSFRPAILSIVVISQDGSVIEMFSVFSDLPIYAVSFTVEILLSFFKMFAQTGLILNSSAKRLTVL